MNGINYEYVNDIDDEILELIEKQSHNHLTPKNRIMFEWLMRYPWILQAPFRDSNSDKYAFSSVRKDFNQYFLKIYNSHHRLVSFVVLTQRDSQLKTPYVYVNEENAHTILKVILAHAMRLGIKTVTTFQPVVTARIRQTWNPFILSRKMNFRILISKHLKDNLGNTDEYFFMEGDGDATFV